MLRQTFFINYNIGPSFMRAHIFLSRKTLAWPIEPVWRSVMCVFLPISQPAEEETGEKDFNYSRPLRISYASTSEKSLQSSM
jgi:hypothetical protein